MYFSAFGRYFENKWSERGSTYNFFTLLTFSYYFINSVSTATRVKDSNQRLCCHLVAIHDTTSTLRLFPLSRSQSPKTLTSSVTHLRKRTLPSSVASVFFFFPLCRVGRGVAAYDLEKKKNPTKKRIYRPPYRRANRVRIWGHTQASRGGRVLSVSHTRGEELIGVQQLTVLFVAKRWSFLSTSERPTWRMLCSGSRSCRRAEAPCASPATTCSSRTGGRAAPGRSCCSSETSLPLRRGERGGLQRHHAHLIKHI